MKAPLNAPLVYDLPTRLFHWLFAGLFIGAFFIGKNFDDTPIFPYHMMLGMTLGLTVVFRIFWGLFGSRYAQFSSFALAPGELVIYFKNLFTGKTLRKLGHNPASSWASLTMMGLALGLGITGFMMAKDINKEAIEEIHEFFGNAFLVVVIAHVGGILFHSLRHKDWIGLSMIHGRKLPVEGEVGIDKPHTAVGLLLLAAIVLFLFNLNRNYDPNTRQLNLFGTTLQLGELEDEKSEGKENEGNEKGEHGSGASDNDHDDD